MKQSFPQVFDGHLFGYVLSVCEVWGLESEKTENARGLYCAFNLFLCFLSLPVLSKSNLDSELLGF